MEKNIAPQARLGVSRETIMEFCRRWNITEFALFGSVVRDDFREDSDVDVLVTFTPGGGPSLENLAAMEEELQKLFGRKVDLVEKRLISNPYRRHNILIEHQVLYPEPATLAEIIREAPKFDRDLGLTLDIVEAGKEIMEISKREGAEVDRVLRAAIQWHLVVIGQAARRLSAEFRAAHPETPWSSIIAERNILVHNYDHVEGEKVWKIALESVPLLVEQLAPLVANPPPDL